MYARGLCNRYVFEVRQTGGLQLRVNSASSRMGRHSLKRRLLERSDVESVRLGDAQRGAVVTGVLNERRERFLQLIEPETGQILHSSTTNSAAKILQHGRYSVFKLWFCRHRDAKSCNFHCNLCLRAAKSVTDTQLADSKGRKA